MKRLTEKQRKRRQEFVSGTVDLTYKQEIHTTQFEQLLDRLGLTEANCHLHQEMVEFCRVNKDRRYIPEIVLHRLRVGTIYDEGEQLAPYSLTASGVVIPEPLTLQPLSGEDGDPGDEEVEPNASSQAQAA
jgi:hypothetical protein